MAELCKTAVLGEGASLLPPQLTSQLRNTSVTQRSARQAGSNQARYEYNFHRSHTYTYYRHMRIYVSKLCVHHSQLHLQLHVHHLYRLNVLFVKRFWRVMRVAFPRVCSKSFILFLILVFARSAGSSWLLSRLLRMFSQGDLVWRREVLFHAP